MPRRTSDRFIDSLLQIPFSDPQSDFIALCDTWLSAINGDWAWLWIKNVFSGDWELRMHRSASHNEYLPKFGFPEGDRSIAQFSAETNGILELEANEFESWSRHRIIDGKRVNYRCLSASNLLTFGCKRFYCVPITNPPIAIGNRNNPHLLELSASICVHYLEQSVLGNSHEDLERMGRISNFFICNSYRSRNERALFRLNQVGAEFAYTEGRNPRNMLNQYVEKVLLLVCEIIGAETATLFFDEERNNNQITCVGSTDSLLDCKSSKLLSPKEMRRAGYELNEGQTGEVFAAGLLRVIHAIEDKNRKPKYVEFRDAQPFLGRTTAFVPLRIMQRGSFKTVGVLRCTGKSEGKHGVFQIDTFDQIDLETLQFVCDQIAPVIQTLIVRIDRERAISIVKHDLVSPISHIRHIADKLETIQEVSVVESIELLHGGKKMAYQMKIPFRDLMNIKTFAIEASNLIYQLDPDFSQLTKLRLEDTFLEGNIIARLKRAMQYHAWEEKQMQITFDGFGNVPLLKLDRGIIERVFYNLISNAIKYGTRKSPIEIRAFESNNHYCVTVSNYGRGVSEEERDLIFDEEYRSNVAIESEVPGLGLGLYIARKAMEKHGGKLEITQLTNPTTFCAYFPTSLRAT